MKCVLRFLEAISFMKHFEYKTRGVCSVKVEFDLDDNKVRNVRFLSGCSGNTQGVSSLAEGMDANELVKRLKGIDCRGRGTSCPDQLAIAVSEALKK